MWSIKKEFDFCYGHRVWSQTLDTDYATDSCLKCRHLHGHQGKVIVELQASVLKDGMVTDFKHLSWFKKWIDDVLDHKFIMDINDPLFTHEVPTIPPSEILWDEQGIGTVPDYEIKNVTPVIWEKYEGMVFVNFVPTSENLCKFLFDIVNRKMINLGIGTKSVQFYETPKSQSIYSI